MGKHKSVESQAIRRADTNFYGSPLPADQLQVVGIFIAAWIFGLPPELPLGSRGLNSFLGLSAGYRLGAESRPRPTRIRRRRALIGSARGHGGRRRAGAARWHSCHSC